MARRANSMIAFPRVRTIYIYMFVTTYALCVVYIVRELRHSRGLGQLMGVAHNTMHTRAEQKESCVAYVETGTNS